MKNQYLKFSAQRVKQSSESMNRNSVQKTAYLRWFCSCFISFYASVAILTHSLAAEVPQSFRIGFTSVMFTDINENDAKAAIKVWGEMIARNQKLPTDPEPIIFDNVSKMLQSLRAKSVDVVGITTAEFDLLCREVHFSPIFVTYHAGSITEQYVLLTHRESSVKTLGDLSPWTMHLYANPRTCLAPIWLETLLRREEHPMITRFTKEISWETKLPNVVLPVFFRQKDACIVTRSGFDIMAELNPQLAGQLSILAESPEMVPAVFAFRADYNPTIKDKIISGVKNLKKTSAGQQVLTIFQSEDILEQPVSHLKPALELISTHKRIMRKKDRP